ncbi:MAG: S1C family serine protease [Dehalococcoidia bacterium]
MSLFSKSALWRRRSLVVAAVVVMITAVLLAGCAKNTTSSTQTQLPAASGTVQVTPLYDENTVVSLYDRTIPAVVQVVSVVESPLSKLPNPFTLQIPKQEGQGSGFFIDAQGHILTNYHVVDGATTVTVITSDGTKYDAKVVGTDPNNDLALLQIDISKASNLAYLVLGDSSKVKPGQMAIALGSPFGLQGSVTVGVISGIGRSIPGSNARNITNIIQTDAAINPGNSGGPLLNSSGEVIGINTAIEASANGVGFAAPINTAKTLLPELLKGGSIKTAWLGIEGMPVVDLPASVKITSDKGVYVVSVLAGSPAEKVGLVASGKDAQGEPKDGGDIITALDNVPVTKVEDMLTYFNGKRPGDSVTLSIIRGGQTLSVPVVLGEWPEQLPATLLQQPGLGDNQTPNQNFFQFGPYQFHFNVK